MTKEFSPYDLNDVAEMMKRHPDPQKRYSAIDASKLNPYDLNDVALINNPNRQREIYFSRRRHVRNHNNRGLLKMD
jgi:hypothetical protein